MAVRLLTLALIAALALGAGCSGLARLDSANAGRTTAYEAGVPNFDMEAVATARDGQLGVDVYLGVPPVSLVFVQTEAGYEAAFETIVRLFDRRGKRLLREAATSDTVRVADYAATEAYRPMVRQKRIEAEGGEYVAEVELIDAESDGRAVRRQRVLVGSPDEEGQTSGPALSRVRLEGQRDGGAFEPIVALHVPADVDSLRAVTELYGLGEADVAEVAMTLFRFESDTSVAVAPYWLSTGFGSLAYRGIRYDRADTLQASRRRVPAVSEAVALEFALPPLAEGVYRIEVAARTSGVAGGADVRLEEFRDVSVKGPAFPRITTMAEMVDALAYVAYPREIEHIQAAPTPQERKRRFDAFWGALLPNRRLAAGLIERYYSRVEEANLLFTSFKEGWKTDRGMVYVVLGAPGYVDRRLDGEVWHYGNFAGQDPLHTFTFERVRLFEGDAVFENYVLQRRPYYERVWFRALDRWRDGTVL